MNVTAIKSSRKTAEVAVADMKDGPLKTKAFEIILSSLLSAETTPARSQGKQRITSGKREGTGVLPETLRARILALKDEGFFATQRSLGEIREALGSRGWHYPLTTLSGAMQRLVRDELRRERVTSGSKKVWKYSNA